MQSTRPHNTKNTKKAGLAALALALATLALLLAPSLATAAAPPPKLWRSCEQGSGAGQCAFPTGAAANPATGHLYIADNGFFANPTPVTGGRIIELTAWGEFVKAWGWGVKDGSPEPQTCTAETGCRAGLKGPSRGQLSDPTGVASDSTGHIYVVDRQDHRVQKFDPDGAFVWMLGGAVNKTATETAGREAEENLCPAPGHPSDICQAGTVGTGGGQFGTLPYGSFIAVGPSDQLYVADSNRIERFNTAGEYQGEIPLLGIGGEGAVDALAADPVSGDLYFSRANTSVTEQVEVQKIDPAGAPLCATEGASLPRALAANPEGGFYAVESLPNGANHIRAFDADCTTSAVPAFGEDELRNGPIGLVTGSACLSSGYDLFVTDAIPDGSFVRAYGPPPDKLELCPPPPNPPAIEAEFASAVDTTEATLKASINPRFWPDTAYYLEYGDAPCSQGGCAQKPLAPGASLGAGAVGSGVTRSLALAGLAPGTAYHYRFVATSHCVASEPEVQCTTLGEDRAFTTFREPGSPPCPNDADRLGSAARLPDCRAYELVSPLDKEGGDIRVFPDTVGVPAVIEQVSPSGERLAYGSLRSFAGAASAPYTSQYIAQRILGREWQTHPLNSPREAPVYGAIDQVRNEFEAFSPDLCQAWQTTFAEPPLAPGAIAGYSNLYLRSDELCGESGSVAYETLAPLAKPVEPHLAFGMQLLGLSVDGRHAALLSDEKLTPEGTPGPSQLYASTRGAGLSFVCVLPDASPFPGPCSAGSLTIGGPGALIGTISDDGRRIYWTDAESGEGRLYLRQNPDQPESARLHGAATGTATAYGPLLATGNAVFNSELLTNVKPQAGGAFALGQQISAGTGGIPPATTITAIEETSPATFKLTLSAKYTKPGKAGIELSGLASETLPALSTQTGAFQAGQQISGPGIPAGTTVLSCAPSCGEGATSLTLSAKATATKEGARLSATSPCTEAATRACTIPVSEAGEAASGTDGSWFWGASADGSTAIYSTEVQGGGSDLYEFDADAALAEEPEATQLIAHRVIGVMGTDQEEARRVYFASRQAIAASGQNSAGDEAAEGEANLYLYEAGTGGAEPSYRFIATLAAADLTAAVSDEAFRKRSARLTPDGLHAAFISRAPLSGYDNLAAAPGACNGSDGRCNELYRYDADANRLDCVSCNPTGARPAGDAQIPTWETPIHAARVLADDGSRLYFESADALSSADTNGATDVYQWEAPAAGTCTTASPTYSPTDGGCLDLISSGQSPLDSRFVEADPTGANVFFATGSGLLPQDYGLIDIYDARVQGGLPVPSPPPPSCEGEACQSPPAPPENPNLATAAHHGPGNVVEPATKPCPKRKVRRHGKCVKRHRKAKHKRSHHRRANPNRRAHR